MSPCGIFRTFGTLQSSGRLCWYGDLVANVWRFPLSPLWHAPWCVHARGSSLCDSSKSVCWLSIMCRYWTLPLTSALSTPITSLPERTHTAHKSQTNVWTGIGNKKTVLKWLLGNWPSMTAIYRLACRRQYTPQYLLQVFLTWFWGFSHNRNHPEA